MYKTQTSTFRKLTVLPRDLLAWQEGWFQYKADNISFVT